MNTKGKGMNHLELSEKIEAINAKIGEVYVSKIENSRPILDGIVNVEKYLNSKYKVLWILKEPWDEADRTGGGWSLPKHILGVDNVYKKIGNNPTFHSMIYVMYSILNDFITWAKMDYIRDNPDMAKIMHNVAYINISKLPGFKQSNSNQILSAYKRYHDIIWEQINLFDPDIIIGCDPHMTPIMTEAGIASLKRHGTLLYGLSNQKLYLNVHHPAQRKIERAVYVNDIIDTIKENYSMAPRDQGMR